MYRLLEVLVVILAALALVPALAHAAEMPGKMRLNRETYLAVQPIYYPGFSIIGIAEPVSALALLALALMTPLGSAPFWFYVAALLALVVMHIVYWTVTHPVNRVWLEGQRLSRAGNRFFGAGRTETHPDGTRDWDQLRRRWEYSHICRAALAVLALALVACGVTR